MRCVWCWMLRCVEKDLHLRFSRFVRNAECIKHACVYAGLAIEDWWQYEACAGISLNRIFNCGQPLVKSSLHCHQLLQSAVMKWFVLHCSAMQLLHCTIEQCIALHYAISVCNSLHLTGTALLLLCPLQKVAETSPSSEPPPAAHVRPTLHWLAIWWECTVQYSQNSDIVKIMQSIQYIQCSVVHYSALLRSVLKKVDLRLVLHCIGRRTEGQIGSSSIFIIIIIIIVVINIIKPY